jgi:hypothetical protein
MAWTSMSLMRSVVILLATPRGVAMVSSAGLRLLSVPKTGRLPKTA